MRLLYNHPVNNGQSFSKVAKLLGRAFSKFGGASFGRSNSAAKRCFQRAYFGGEYAPQISPLVIGADSRSFRSAHSRSASVKRPFSQFITAPRSEERRVGKECRCRGWTDRVEKER